MMKASVIIGANYGDEGKGLITDYLASSSPNLNTLVIRFNGGAQAGHTVQTSQGLRHVFSHFSSGTFAGAQTYLSHFFIANPILFTQELKKLKSYCVPPTVMIHPDAMVTTPYDMYINQMHENFREKNRHGSCGVGINETIERNLHEEFQLTVKDLYDQKNVKSKLIKIRDKWLALRLEQLIFRKLTGDEKALIFSNEIFDRFFDDIHTFFRNCDVADYSYFKKWDKLIFEGAQGLLLDQGHKNFPHVTRSNTGLENVSTLASLSGINHLDVHYVSRCYLTRHGAGPLSNELSSCPCPYFKDETNIPHKFQGALRFAPLNVVQLNVEIIKDLNKLSNQISKNVTVAVTCLDQFEEKIAVAEEEKIFELGKRDFLNYVFSKVKFDNYLLSYGPTREDCKPVKNAFLEKARQLLHTKI